MIIQNFHLYISLLCYYFKRVKNTKSNFEIKRRFVDFVFETWLQIQVFSYDIWNTKVTKFPKNKHNFPKSKVKDQIVINMNYKLIFGSNFLTLLVSSFYFNPMKWKLNYIWHKLNYFVPIFLYEF